MGSDTSRLFEEFNDYPGGWYLTGVVVDPRFRRRGIGAALTAARGPSFGGESFVGVEGVLFRVELGS